MLLYVYLYVMIDRLSLGDNHCENDYCFLSLFRQLYYWKLLKSKLFSITAHSADDEANAVCFSSFLHHPNHLPRVMSAFIYDLAMFMYVY